LRFGWIGLWHVVDPNLSKRHIRNEHASDILKFFSLHELLDLRKILHTVTMLNKLRVCSGNATRNTLFQVLGSLKEDEVSNRWSISTQEILVSKVFIDLGIDFDTFISNHLPGTSRSEHHDKPYYKCIVQDALNSVAVSFILRSFADYFRSSFQGNVLVHCNTLSDSSIAVDDVGHVYKRNLVTSLNTVPL